MDERDGPNVRDVLHRLDETLAQAARRLEALDEATRAALVAQLLGLRAGIQAAAETARATSGTAAWLHGIRDAVTVVAGWVELLVTAGNEARRVHARRALDQSLRTLRERLTQPPG